jgi:hypothetical protein
MSSTMNIARKLLALAVAVAVVCVLFTMSSCTTQGKAVGSAFLNSVKNNCKIDYGFQRFDSAWFCLSCHLPIGSIIPVGQPALNTPNPFVIKNPELYAIHKRQESIKPLPPSDVGKKITVNENDFKFSVGRQIALPPKEIHSVKKNRKR